MNYKVVTKMETENHLTNEPFKYSKKYEPRSNYYWRRKLQLFLLQSTSYVFHNVWNWNVWKYWFFSTHFLNSRFFAVMTVLKDWADTDKQQKSGGYVNHFLGLTHVTCLISVFYVCPCQSFKTVSSLQKILNWEKPTFSTG